MKINISMDDDLVKRVEDYADNNYLSRSAMISLACSVFLNQNEAVLAVRNLSLAIQKIADTGNIDSETLKQMEDFSRLSSLLVK